MSSIRTFCVRWLAMIVIVAGVAVPVSRAVAEQSRPAPVSGQEAAPKR